MAITLTAVLLSLAARDAGYTTAQIVGAGCNVPDSPVEMSHF
jgi:hypothetical protein